MYSLKRNWYSSYTIYFETIFNSTTITVRNHLDSTSYSRLQVFGFPKMIRICYGDVWKDSENNRNYMIQQVVWCTNNEGMNKP